MKKSISILAAVILVLAMFVGCNAENSAKLVTIGFGMGTKAIIDETVSAQSAVDHYTIKVTDVSGNTYRYLKFYALDGSEVKDYSTRGNEYYSYDSTKGEYTFNQVPKTSIDGENATGDNAPKFTLSQGTWTFEVTAYAANTYDAESGNRTADGKKIGYGKTENQIISNAANQSVTVIVGEDYDNTEYVDLTIVLGSKLDGSAFASSIWTSRSTKDANGAANGTFQVVVDKVENESDNKTYPATQKTSSTTLEENKIYYEYGADVYRDYVMGSMTVSVPTGTRTVKLQYLDGSGAALRTYPVTFKVNKETTLTITAGEFIHGEYGNPAITITTVDLSLGEITLNGTSKTTFKAGAVDNIPSDWQATSYTTEYTWYIGNSDAAAGTGETLDVSALSTALTKGEYEVTCKAVVTLTDDASRSWTVYKNKSFGWDGEITLH